MTRPGQKDIYKAGIIDVGTLQGSWGLHLQSERQDLTSQNGPLIKNIDLAAALDASNPDEQTIVQAAFSFQGKKTTGQLPLLNNPITIR